MPCQTLPRQGGKRSEPWRHEKKIYLGNELQGYFLPCNSWKPLFCPSRLSNESSRDELPDDTQTTRHWANSAVFWHIQRRQTNEPRLTRPKLSKTPLYLLPFFLVFLCGGVWIWIGFYPVFWLASCSPCSVRSEKTHKRTFWRVEKVQFSDFAFVCFIVYIFNTLRGY